MNKIVRIEELCKKITDGSHFSPSDEMLGQYPMFSVKDMTYNGFDDSDCKHINIDVFEKLARSDCRPLKNDILIAKDGSYLKHVFKCEEDLNACILSSIAILRPNLDVINPDFFVYVLRTLSVKKAMANYVSGSALPRIILSDFKKMKIKINMDKIWQEKVSDILLKYDDLIENNNKRIKILEQMAENLYKEWFVRFRFPGHETTEFENGLPKGWKVEKIKGNIKRLPFNRLYKEREIEKEGKIIVIDQSTDEYLGFHNNEPSHFANYEKPIILFGDHSCKFKLMCKDFSLGENVIPFYSNDETVVKSIFLYYSIHKLITTEEYKRHWNRLINMKILMPPVELQIKYSEIIITFIKEVDKLWLQNQNLAKQRDMLLPRLMSGKFEVN